MIETHAIRLRGPWECQIEGGASRRVHMPAAVAAAILNDTPAGRLVCRRRFGCPTCLDPHERVWLVIEGAAQLGQANLNHEPLGRIGLAQAVHEYDITGRLCQRNEIVINFDIAALQAADTLLFADVRLEIRG